MENTLKALGLNMDYLTFLESIVDRMASGLMIVDGQGHIVGVNRSLERMTGFTDKELLGRSCAVFSGDTCIGPDGECVFPHCELFKNGQVERKRCSIRCRDGSSLKIVKDGNTLVDEQGRPRAGVEIITDISALVEREREVAMLKRELAASPTFHGMVGETRVMTMLFEMIKDAAGSDAPVILFGESGTGKELAAAAIHAESDRAKAPYLVVNCASLNENLLESELFGHVRGAFTGASRNRVGRFEAAHQGSILIDEVGELPLSVQVKLLRIIETGVLEKVGDHVPIPVDVRMISATHRNLAAMVDSGAFRQDLFYRLNVIPIHIPPLRERPEDIPLLVNHFLGRLRHTSRRPVNTEPQALDILMNYKWPGNVRELINVLEYAAVTSRTGTIAAENLPPHLKGLDLYAPTASRPTQGSATHPNQTESLAQILDETDRIREALKKTGGNKAAAARLLGISRVGLWKKMKRLGLMEKGQNNTS